MRNVKLKSRLKQRCAILTEHNNIAPDMVKPEMPDSIQPDSNGPLDVFFMLPNLNA